MITLVKIFQKLIFVLILMPFKSTAQINTYVFTYGMQIISDERHESIVNKSEYGAIIHDLFVKAQNNQDKIKFELVVQDSITHFCINDLRLNNSFTGYFGEILTLKDSIYKNPYKVKNITIVNPKNLTWEITSDTLRIGEYLCIKAKGTELVTYQNKTFYNPIYAWFCPDIPISVGPNGFCGLPGAILKLQKGNSIFGLINFRKESRPMLVANNFFQKNKITQELYHQKLEEQISNFEN